MKLLKYIVSLIIYFPLITFLVALFWSTQISGKLFICTDPFPILDFIPPFVHDPKAGDYYIVNPAVVWGIWVGLIILDIGLTIFFSKKFNPFKV